MWQGSGTSPPRSVAERAPPHRGRRRVAGLRRGRDGGRLGVRSAEHDRGAVRHGRLGPGDPDPRRRRPEDAGGRADPGDRHRRGDLAGDSGGRDRPDGPAAADRRRHRGARPLRPAPGLGRRPLGAGARLDDGRPDDRRRPGAADPGRRRGHSYTHPGVAIDQFGDGSANKWFNETIGKDFQRAEWTAVPLALGILLVAFGAFLAAVLPVGLALTSFLAANGLLALVSRRLPLDSSTSSVMLLIGLAVGVDYCMFYLRREREERAQGRDPETALRIAAATSGRSVLVSGRPSSWRCRACSCPGCCCSTASPWLRSSSSWSPCSDR